MTNALHAHPTDKKWHAVLARHPADFIYAVKTTGIYCRPGCASRSPRRTNVEFFSSAAEAVRAGYRACKRCTPDSPPQFPAWATTACQNLSQPDAPSLPELAAAANMSARHFHRMFKNLIGVTPKQYAQSARGKRWRDNLQTTKRITDAIYDSGFNSSARVYEDPAADLGMTPAAWQNGGAGVDIRYAIAPCYLGLMLVAATTRGVCTLAFSDSQKQLKNSLVHRFPKADISPGGADFKQWINRALQLLNKPQTALALPLDIRGTAFQVQVWRALRQIPHGQTASYSDIANALDSPRAVRAVATACAANPVAVAVPCHRVVGKNGNLCGYRWGLNRKRALLKQEKVK